MQYLNANLIMTPIIWLLSESFHQRKVTLKVIKLRCLKYANCNFILIMNMITIFQDINMPVTWLQENKTELQQGDGDKAPKCFVY